MLSKKLDKTTNKSVAVKKQVRMGLLFVLLVAAAGVGAFFYLSPPAPSSRGAVGKSLVPVEKGTIDFKVSCTGVIKPYNQVKISPKFTGLLQKLMVQQGDVVKKGQVIAYMDNSNLEGQWRAARAAMELAQANYDKSVHGLRPQEIRDSEARYEKATGQVRFATMAMERSKAELAAAEASLKRDEINARRLTMLAGQGAISEQEQLNALTLASVSKANLEKAKQDVKAWDAQLSQALSDLESARNMRSMAREGSRTEDVRAAQSALLQAKGTFQFLQSQMNDMRIVAPFDGIVTQKYTDEGAIVTPTTSAATTSATSSSIVSLAGRLELVAAVAETDMQYISQGQEVVIIANAFPDKKFHARVSLIAPEAVVTQNVTSFEVHAVLQDDPHHMLRSGMNVNAEFLAGKKDGVMLIPTSCVVSKHGKTGVYVPDEKGQPEFKSVSVGASAGTKTQINYGLKEGDKVFIGLTKSQLIEEGYTTDPIKSMPGAGGSNSTAPVPRGLGGGGKKM
ncbi:MAG: efflux RND transporter periplasmic adaptor subunit [Candidatus Obscuribacterales bacterium]|nr:efflux RND transporter periplasmic adaptor subunit [Candidatus Obscuribacterales bacterium]